MRTENTNPSIIVEPSLKADDNFTIQPATRDEMKHVIQFVRSSADWYKPFLDPKDFAEHDVDEAWAEKNFKKRDFYLGYADDEPVGTISLQHFGSVTYLGYIYLDANHVGKRYGHRLMKFAEHQSRHKGMDAMVLIAHPEATWATKAYKKFGFDVIASERHEVVSWRDGLLESYYEEGFELYHYPLESVH